MENSPINITTTSTNTPATIHEAVDKFSRMVLQSRSVNTSLSYTKGLKLFINVLEKNGLPGGETPASQITEDLLPGFLDALKVYAPATEQLYAATVTRFFNFLMAEKMAEINLPRMKEIIRMRTRRLGQRLPQFPRSDIEHMIDFILPMPVNSDDNQFMRDLRDRAFLLVLADTGLRVHEACNLRRGDLDWNEGHAVIIGKGDKQAVVRFSSRSMNALKDYLKARARLDGSSGRPMSSLPIFARHDKGVGKKIKGMTPTTGRNIVEENNTPFVPALFCNNGSACFGQFKISPRTCPPFKYLCYTTVCAYFQR